LGKPPAPAHGLETKLDRKGMHTERQEHEHLDLAIWQRTLLDVSISSQAKMSARGSCLIDVIRIYLWLERGGVKRHPERSVTGSLASWRADERGLPCGLGPQGDELNAGLDGAQRRTIPFKRLNSPRWVAREGAPPTVVIVCIPPSVSQSHSVALNPCRRCAQPTSALNGAN